MDTESGASIKGGLTLWVRTLWVLSSKNKVSRTKVLGAKLLHSKHRDSLRRPNSILLILLCSEEQARVFPLKKETRLELRLEKITIWSYNLLLPKKMFITIKVATSRLNLLESLQPQKRTMLPHNLARVIFPISQFRICYLMIACEFLLSAFFYTSGTEPVRNLNS